MKTADYLFDLRFLKRFSIRRVFFLLSGSFVCGVISGTIAVKLFGLPNVCAIFPFLSCKSSLIGLGVLKGFSGVLMNMLIYLIAIFLLGVTAFGAFGIPLMMLYRGAAAAVSVLFMLGDGDFSTLGYSALFITPVSAAASLLLILFATRALVFSRGLARAGFSQQHETLDFRHYFNDFIYFLCFSVPVSFAGCLLAALYGLFQTAGRICV